MIKNSEAASITSLKALIKNFLQERLQEKLDKEKDDEKIQKLKHAYLPENWLADAARRVSQIQLVTHAVKFLNPGAKGASSIYLNKQPSSTNPSNPTVISTNTLLEKKDDVVGNAAALDIVKFLQLRDGEETLLSRMLRNDPALRGALPGTAEQKAAWIEAFINITKAKGIPATHTLAKQVYFPLENDTATDHYHLLAPLFPTSLVQAVFEKIRTRFDEATQAARKAKRKKKPHPCGYREYLNLAVQNFGGSKPQNISLLNSARGGKAYLLPSLPPNWKSQPLNPPLNITSIFSMFGYRVRYLIKVLRKFLEKTDHTNQLIRQTRADLVAEIMDQLLFFVAKIQQLPADWSQDVHCKLSPAQRFWLDPHRANQDVEWRQQRQHSDWQSEVSHDFALWLNQNLQSKTLHFGDEEHREWKRLIQQELSLLKEII